VVEEVPYQVESRMLSKELKATIETCIGQNVLVKNKRHMEQNL